MMESVPVDSSAQPEAKSPPVESEDRVNDVEPLAYSSDTGASDKANVDEGVAYANNAAVHPPEANAIRPIPVNVTASQTSPHESVPFLVAPSGVSTWARNFSFPQPRAPRQEPAQGGLFGSLTKGIVDSSLSAVKAVQVKARHMVSQNKRRYQEGEFDLDMTYITENIIAMGFPAGNLSSGLFGYLEGFYRNHMEDVIKFFETHHKGRYKVYNLCSERLYDASLFEGKVASFPFNDHNCPPLQLIPSFCQSAYSWLKGDIENVVVVHCKAGMGRTGVMICSLLLFLQLSETAEQAITFFNQKRCVDGRALVLPSQIRYVKYYEHILKNFSGASQPGRRCMLRGFRLHKCPYWIRPSITISNHSGILFSTKKHQKTKDLMPEDFWIKVPKKGITVFALPGEPGLAEVVGDFKIYFHDRHGDFYCWLNTTLTENRKILDGSDFDGFDKRKLPSPGLQIEIIIIDYDGTLPTRTKGDSSVKVDRNSGHNRSDVEANSSEKEVSANEDNDDVFSDEEGEELGSSKRNQQSQSTAGVGESMPKQSSHHVHESIGTVTRETNSLSLGSPESTAQRTSGVAKPAPGQEMRSLNSVGSSDIKAIAADASVFSFGDEEDYESE